MNDSLIRDYCATLGLTENYQGRQRQDDEEVSRE